MRGWAKIKESARYAGVSVRTFRKWIKRGLKHSKLPSGLILVHKNSIDDYICGFEVDENQTAKMVDEVVADFLGK